MIEGIRRARSPRQPERGFGLRKQGGSRRGFKKTTPGTDQSPAGSLYTLSEGWGRSFVESDRWVVV